MSRVLVTGGAGFIGANLSVALARSGSFEVIALDSLHRTGSELNLGRLSEAGVEFVQADVRDREALERIRGIEHLVECSAEPSALAGMSGDTRFVFETNLIGAYNCLELARREGAQLIFLSTSRVYPHPALNDLELTENQTRFELAARQPFAGASAAGIGEEFPLEGAKTLYGATKLAAEHLIAEYAASFGVATVINRCGVIAGPWQMGRVDQGVFTYWLARHELGLPLTYLGYGGEGRQVRDLLHVDDLVALIQAQLAEPALWAGFLGNVGGGTDSSLSLREATALCRELTSNEVPIAADGEPRPGDVPLYISDCARLFAECEWRPRSGPREILADTLAWIRANGELVGDTLAGG